VDIIALADAAGTAATGSYAVTGTATAPGQVALSIAGTRVLVAVSAGDTNTAIAINAANLIATLSALPITAAAVSGSLNLTAKHVGVVGNSLDLEVTIRPDDALPPGITLAVTAMSGGVGTPTLATVLSTIASQWYTDIIVPWTDSATLAVLTAELARRYTATGRLDMMAWAGLTGSYASQLTAIGGAVVNSPFLTLANWPNMIDPPWVTAAAVAAVGIFNLTNDPARQLKALAIPGLTAPLPANRIIETQENNFLNNGLSVFRYARDGSVMFHRQVTTAQQSSLGVPDYSWRDVMVAKTMTRIRWDWKTYLSLTYPRNKLADDGSIAAEYDDTIVTPRRLGNAWRGRSRLYEQQGWIENSALTAASSVFARDTSDRNRVNARQRVQIIGNMMVFAGALEFEV